MKPIDRMIISSLKGGLFYKYNLSKISFNNDTKAVDSEKPTLLHEVFSIPQVTIWDITSLPNYEGR